MKAPQQQQAASTSSSSVTTKRTTSSTLASFDRLVPRYCDESGRKRKGGDLGEAEPEAKRASKSCSAKKEYSKLRNLVPALSEREDLSKVEIIEETIRYIDALHHQLAARAINANQSSEAAETSTEAVVVTTSTTGENGVAVCKIRYKIPLANITDSCSCSWNGRKAFRLSEVLSYPTTMAFIGRGTFVRQSLDSHFRERNTKGRRRNFGLFASQMVAISPLSAKAITRQGN